MGPGAEAIPSGLLADIGQNAAVNAPFIVSKAVIPSMIRKGGGKIINICSMMSELGPRCLLVQFCGGNAVHVVKRLVFSAHSPDRWLKLSGRSALSTYW